MNAGELAKGIRLEISRINPEMEQAPTLTKYTTVDEKGLTILQALIQVYEEIDSTLAFGWGCRDRRCGLCGVEANNKPRLGCLTNLRPNMVLRPLSKLPLIRDLMIDRSWIFATLERLKLYIPSQDEGETLQTIILPQEHKQLMRCNECLCCLSACPNYHFEDSSFAGPFVFVKLAQLHFDPRNQIDRRAQAHSLGIEKCLTCRSCYCALGLPIFRLAIVPLLR